MRNKILERDELRIGDYIFVVPDIQLFLKDRGLLDSVLVANEVVDKFRRYGRSGLFLKVDFQKAYDSVRWAFLYDMLQRLDFHEKCIKWVKGCVKSASLFVWVNGSPTEEFNPGRGLR